MAHTNLFVSGLPDVIDDSTFRSLFEPYGTLISSKCFPDKRHGFVKYSATSECDNAIAGLNNSVLAGSTVTVRYSTNDVGSGKGDPSWGGNSWGAGGDSWTAGAGSWGSSPGGKGSGFDAEPMPSDNLYIKGFPQGTTEDLIRQVFGAYGAVTSVKVLETPEGAPVAALVRMGDLQQATWLVTNLNGNIPQGLSDPLVVKYASKGKGKGKGDKSKGLSGMGGGDDAWGGSGACGSTWGPSTGGSWSSPPPAVAPEVSQDNLYIKGLPVGTTEERVRQIFGPYGTIISLKVLPTPDGADNTAALVKFGDIAQAAWLVENLNGNIPSGLSTPVTVRYATSSNKGKGKEKGQAEGLERFGPYAGKGTKGPPTGQQVAWAAGMQISNGSDESNLYIRGLPPQADDLYLYKVFAPLGAIVSVKAILAEHGCAGYGFVKYANVEDANKAIELLNSTPLPDGTWLIVSVKMTKNNNSATAAAAAAAAAALPALTADGGLDLAALVAAAGITLPAGDSSTADGGMIDAGADGGAW